MNMLNMIKQATGLKKQMKKMQKELAKKTVEGVSGGVTVVARGDMSIASVSSSPEMVDPTKVDKLEKSVASAVGSALDSAKKMAASEMANMAGGLGGLADMLGG